MPERLLRVWALFVALQADKVSPTGSGDSRCSETTRPREPELSRWGLPERRPDDQTLVEMLRLAGPARRLGQASVRRRNLVIVSGTSSPAVYSASVAAPCLLYSPCSDFDALRVVGVRALR